MPEIKHKIVCIASAEDIPPQIRETPFAHLLEFHNLNKPFSTYETAELAIVMCMDNRKQLNLPPRFAYILRTAGARITGHEFKLSFVIGFGDIKFVALISHTNCGMVKLSDKRQKVVDGLVKNAGWTKAAAEKHFDSFAPSFEIHDEVDFVASEAKRLKKQFPLIEFAPFLYKVDDNRLYLIEAS